MAGRLKEGLSRMGRKALYGLELVALAFWIGGGLAVGALVLVFVGKRFPEKADEIASGVFQWLSIAEVIVGAVLCALIFLVDRKRRGGLLTLIGFAVMAAAAAVNQFIIAGLLGNAPRSTIYLAVFFGTMALALVMFLVLALSGRTFRPAAAAAPVSGLAPAPAAPAPPAALEPEPIAQSPPPAESGPVPPEPPPGEPGSDGRT